MPTSVSSEDLNGLSISRYELKLRACQATDLPSFLGSTLRGAFGHALKEVVCVMNHRNCEKCLVVDRCIYPYLFETTAPANLTQLRGQQQLPHPFILSPPIPDCQSLNSSRENREKQRLPNASFTSYRQRLAENDELSFGLLLMGRAADHLPYIVYTISEMARRGLGIARAQFELSSVAILDRQGTAEVIYTSENQKLSMPPELLTGLGILASARLEQLAARSTVKDIIRLRFLTPARIRTGRDLQTGLDFQLLLRNLLRRISSLILLHGQSQLNADYRALIDIAGTIEMRSANLQWWDFERYSNRQQTKMKMGGFIGEIEYQGTALANFLPVIAAGELLHIGTGTSFGLGRYQIEY